MRYIKFHMYDKLERTNKECARFAIGPGAINGVLHMVSFVDPDHAIDKSHGFLKFTFGFASSENAAFVHLGVLALSDAWPMTGCVRAEAGRFRPEVTVRDLSFDASDFPALRYPDDRKAPRPEGKAYQTFELRAEEEAIAVRRTFSATPRGPKSDDTKLVIEYSIAYRDILWRNAPSVKQGVVMPEQMSHCWIRATGLPPMQGIKPSTIVVTYSPGIQPVTLVGHARPVATGPPAGGRLPDRGFVNNVLKASPSSISFPVRSDESEARQLQSTAGTLSIPRGSVEGALSLAAYRRPNEDHDLGAAVVFDFVDAERIGLRHSSLVRLSVLLPDESTRAEIADESPHGGLELRSVLDWRDDYEFKLTQGAPIRGRFKYTDATITLRPTTGVDALEVWLRFHHGVDSRARGDYFVIRYQKPVASLLWRNAPLIYPDDVIAEAAGVVMVEMLEQPPAGIPASRIRLRRGSQTS